jgi:hypothetical protein
MLTEYNATERNQAERLEKISEREREREREKTRCVLNHRTIHGAVQAVFASC